MTNNKCIFLLAGDWNARVGNRLDFVENESLFNLDMLPNDYIEDTYIPRKSQDVNVNDYGLRFLEFLKLTGFKIMNGKVGDDKNIGKFTCVKHAGSSVVDYVIQSVRYPHIC